MHYRRVSLIRMTEDATTAQEFSDLFRSVYLTFHRRDQPRSQLSGASRAVLEHLALAGPLTVGEAAAHLSRAQSVVSDMVSHLERDGLLERVPDPADRRRTLVWLTDEGHGVLRREHDVLDVKRVALAFTGLPPSDARRLLDSLHQLVAYTQEIPINEGES